MKIKEAWEQNSNKITLWAAVCLEICFFGFLRAREMSLLSDDMR